MTESQESQRRTEDFKTRSELFKEALDVDDVIAHLLVTEGFSSVDELAEVPTKELISIEGFDEDVASELQERAKTFLIQLEDKLKTELEAKKIDPQLFETGLKTSILNQLFDKGIKTLDDLADLATDELLEMLPAKTLHHDEAEAIIMKARAHWFKDEEA
jgi:N utilization substance protein A